MQKNLIKIKYVNKLFLKKLIQLGIQENPVIQEMLTTKNQEFNYTQWKNISRIPIQIPNRTKIPAIKYNKYNVDRHIQQNICKSFIKEKN